MFSINSKRVKAVESAINAINATLSVKDRIGTDTYVNDGGKLTIEYKGRVISGKVTVPREEWQLDSK